MSQQQIPVTSHLQTKVPAAGAVPPQPVPLDPSLFALVAGGSTPTTIPRNNW